MSFGLGLRAKSVAALLLACLLALVPAAFIGWQVLEGVRNHFGEAYARNFTRSNLQGILAPVSRDLALSRRLADSILARQWLLDEDNPEKRDLFFREAEGYRRDFRDHGYFLISALSRHYYLNDVTKPYSEEPRYTLERDKAEDAWFFSSMAHTEDYNLNVNADVQLKTTRVWLNVVVKDGERKIGLAGTGLDLGSFLKDFIATRAPGVTPMIVDGQGAIQAHPDPALIAYGSAAGVARQAPTLFDQLAGETDRQALRAALREAEAAPGEVHTRWLSLGGRPQLLALAYTPELKWHVLTAVDLQAAQVLDGGWLRAAVAALGVVLGVLLLAFAWAVDRLILQPVRKLQQSASKLASGNFEVSLPPPRGDELGDLSRAFGTMARQLKANTEELEHKVQERTRELEQANQDMRRAHQQINDSIDYASLIQRAILPDQQMAQRLGPHHAVLWRPRDVVGGDFYVFRAENDCYLVGVVDCAGHGVPGALMTMLARAALDYAMGRVGIASPAAILRETDATLRGMLEQCELPRGLATNMDAGLAWVDRAGRRIRYAGARISLYWSDGETVGELKGTRRALVDRKLGEYRDSEVPLERDSTYYLATDGFLDQAGGELGYSFGNTRFGDMLRRHARRPMHEQAAALDRELQAYRGSYAQRDDVTILSFRFD